MPMYVLREPAAPFKSYFGVYQSMEATPHFHMCIYAQNSTIYRLAQIHAHQSIAVGVLPLQQVRTVAVQSMCIRPLQCHSHVFEAHLGACKLFGATYSTMHHTNQSIAIPVSYYVQLCTHNMLIAQIRKRTSALAIRVTSRSNLGLTQIAIRVTGSSGSAVVTRFQHCAGLLFVY